MAVNMALTVDEARVASIEKNIKDIHSWFTADTSTKLKLFFKHQFKSHYFILPPTWKIIWRMRNVNQRCAPKFMSTGVVRSGTSTLSNYIMQHPCVVLPLSKEVGSFSPTMNAIKAQFPLEKELENVRSRYGFATTGDFTPIMPGFTQLYLSKALNPNMKYVITLRNPVARTLSHCRWHLMLAKQIQQDPLWQAMPDIEDMMFDEIETFTEGGLGYMSLAGAANTGFLRQSIYLPFLKKLYTEVPHENILVIASEDLFHSPESVIPEVYKFLELPEYMPVKINETNPSKPIDFSDNLVDSLQDFFRDKNQSLYKFLGKDFNW